MAVSRRLPSGLTRHQGLRLAVQAGELGMSRGRWLGRFHCLAPALGEPDLVRRYSRLMTAARAEVATPSRNESS